MHDANGIQLDLIIKSLAKRLPSLNHDFNRSTKDVEVWGSFHDGWIRVLFKRTIQGDYECAYKALNKKGNPARINAHIDMSKSFDECLSAMLQIFDNIRAYNNYTSLQQSKQKQINSLNDIVIHGLMNKYPTVTKAFNACNRNAKNFCNKKFKNGKLVIDAKFTITEVSKLDKVFEALEEALKE
jgi:hypothetical protein